MIPRDVKRSLGGDVGALPAAGTVTNICKKKAPLMFGHA